MNKAKTDSVLCFLTIFHFFDNLSFSALVIFVPESQKELYTSFFVYTCMITHKPRQRGSQVHTSMKLKMQWREQNYNFGVSRSNLADSNWWVTCSVYAGMYWPARVTTRTHFPIQLLSQWCYLTFSSCVAQCLSKHTSISLVHSLMQQHPWLSPHVDHQGRTSLVPRHPRGRGGNTLQNYCASIWGSELTSMKY